MSFGEIKAVVDPAILGALITSHWGLLNSYSVSDPDSPCLVYREQISQLVACFAPYLKDLTSDEVVAIAKEHFGEVTANGFKRNLK